MDGNLSGACLATSCGIQQQQKQQEQQVPQPQQHQQQMQQQQQQQQQQQEQQQQQQHEVLEQACIGSHNSCSVNCGDSRCSSGWSCCCTCHSYCCCSCSVSWRERARRQVERDLLSRGFIVREGLALGVDFLCYAASPSEAHASFVVYIHPLLPSSRNNCSSSSSTNRSSSNCSNRSSSCCCSNKFTCDVNNNSSKIQRTCSCQDVSEAAPRSGRDSCSCSSSSSSNNNNNNNNSVLPACFLVGLQRLAQSSKKVVLLALMRCCMQPHPLYIQLDRLKASSDCALLLLLLVSWHAG
ncbi:hypothetical protein ACSSS7_006762 [Eimeria intestinalis]